MTYVRTKSRRFWLPAALTILVVLAATLAATVPAGKASKSAASPIKIAILSDCQGAFASNYEQDIGGAITALAQFAGTKPKNPNKPSAGWTGGKIGGHPLKLVGIGCSNDKADTAIKETRRLMEQLGADVMVGPLSGDESVAVANYAKQHPTKTVVNGTAGAWDTTAAVKAPNYYSFGYASGAGMIADFCAAGGTIVKRVFPPLNATDFSSYARQLPDPSKVDGYFWAVGGTGTIPSLKAFEQAHGKIAANKVIGNLFFFASGADKQLGPRLNGAYVGGFGSSPDLKSAAVTKYKAILDRWYKKYPPLAGKASDHAADGFTYNYYLNAWGLVKALKAVNGDISGGQKKLQTALRTTSVDGAYGKVTLDKNRQAIQDQYSYRMDVKAGALSIVTVQFIPKVAQSFGGAITKAPSRTSPACAHKKLPWTGKERPVVNGVVK